MILVIDNYDSFTWNLVHYLMGARRRSEGGAQRHAHRGRGRSPATPKRS
ncbi:MAG: hypothetical protein WDN44_10480 [Sphingomonas sp.]